MSKQFKVSENIIMWAFRYALTRRIGAAPDVVSILKEYWNDLLPSTRRQIKEEIRNAFSIDNAGDYCDISSWQEVLKLGIPISTKGGTFNRKPQGKSKARIYPTYPKER